MAKKIEEKKVPSFQKKPIVESKSQNIVVFGIDTPDIPAVKPITNPISNINENLTSNMIKDLRKFSILDIPSNSINLFSNAPEKLDEVNSADGESDFTTSILHSTSYLNIKKFQSAKEKAFYILAAHNILDVNQRTFFACSRKVIRENISQHKIVADSCITLQSRKRDIFELFSKNGVSAENFKTKYFPSNTAQNGLNFLTVENGKELINSDTTEVSDFTKILSILLKCNMGENLEGLMKVHSVNNLKQLFFKIFKTTYIDHSLTNTQIHEINSILAENKTLIIPSEITKLNIYLSYASFSLKEIYEYINLVNPNTQVRLYQFRGLYKELIALEKEEEKIRKL